MKKLRRIAAVQEPSAVTRRCFLSKRRALDSRPTSRYAARPTMRFTISLISLIFLAACAAARAADAPPAAPENKTLPGHSMNGEAFNEGPRQRAVLMPGMGGVHLGVTTKIEEAQKFFDQGLGQIHGFWYFEAERSFRQAAALDADCAMAYWGMAMANINNPQRAAGFIKEAVKRKEKAGRHEQLYIAAWADFYAEKKKDENVRRKVLVKALEDLSYEFPDDIEAKALLVFQLWENKGHDVPLASRQAADRKSVV